jgi:alpha-N-arabinofuranosidase
MEVDVEMATNLVATASRRNGAITLTVSNASLESPADFSVLLLGAKAGTAAGRVLTNKAEAHNTFEAPGTVAPAPLAVRLEEGAVRFTLPACSVADYHLNPKTRTIVTQNIRPR